MRKSFSWLPWERWCSGLQSWWKNIILFFKISISVLCTPTASILSAWPETAHVCERTGNECHTQGDVALWAWQCVRRVLDPRNLKKAVVCERGSVGWVEWSPWQRGQDPQVRGQSVCQGQKNGGGCLLVTMMNVHSKSERLTLRAYECSTSQWKGK